MGQSIMLPSNASSIKEEINKNRFEFLNIIGRGGFGKVWKVIEKKTKNHYALKEMNKAKIIDKKSVKSIKYERELLEKLHHSYIVNMHYAFQDYDNLYIVLDLLTGGDLRYHISKYKRFTEEQTKFFIACIIISLEYVHSNNIIHRDIKPENLVLDSNGYLRITDFGIAKQYKLNNLHETSGTPGYMSPEVLKAQNHGYTVDYYAVGVIGYEFMLGKRPYSGKTRKEVKEQMMMKQVCLKEKDIPNGWHIESVAFINKLLQRKQEKRLGFNGIKEIKDHAWYKAYPWDYLLTRKMLSPFIPLLKDNFDKKYCEGIEKQGLETKARYEQCMRNYNYNDLFIHYTYFIDNTIQKNQTSNSLLFHNHGLSKQRCQSAINLQIKQNEEVKAINYKKNDNQMSTKQIQLIKDKGISLTSVPIPISHNKQCIKSMTNLCISPYMMHNKQHKDIINKSFLSSIHNNTPLKEEVIQNNKYINEITSQCKQKYSDNQRLSRNLDQFLSQQKQINVKSSNQHEIYKAPLSNQLINQIDKQNLTAALSFIRLKNLKTNT